MVGKYLVLIAAIAAAVGLFLPFLSPAEGSMADAVIKAGLATPPDVSIFALLTSPPEDLDADAKSGLILMAAPIAVLLLVALLSMALRYGRLLGVLALLAGAAAGGFNYIAYTGAAENPDVTMGLGLMLMMGGGGLGALAGLLGIAMPQKAEDGDKKKKKDKK